MKRKLARSRRFPQIFITFAKNTAHIERRLKNNAYLCGRDGESVADMTKEALSFSSW